MLEKFTLGVFAGILNNDGKVLLRRRILPEETNSLTGKKVFGDYELPGGKAEQAEMLSIGNERGLLVALSRETKEEIDINIYPKIETAMYPAVFCKKLSEEKIVMDIALVFVLLASEWNGKPKGEIAWVNPSQLKKLAEEPKGKQLLSGWGKRMCRMTLFTLCHGSYGKEAKRMLATIQDKL